MTAAPIAGSGGITKNARRDELEESLGTGLRLLAQDAALVAPSARDWWTRYLETHRVSRSHASSPDRSMGVSVRATVRGRRRKFPRSVLRRAGAARIHGLRGRPCSRTGRRSLGKAWDQSVETRHGLEDLPIASASVAFATLSEVLERLRVNPFKPLREIHRVLEPGGHVLISVPHVSPRHRIRFLLGKDYQGDIISEYRSLEEIGHMGHYRLLSRAEIRAMLTYTGFEVKSEFVTGWLPRGKWAFVRFLGPLRNRFRSHYYVVAEKRLEEPGDYA